MRLTRILVFYGVALAVAAGRATAQRDVAIRLYRAGDTTVSVRGAQVTIDHVIEAGNTDAKGIVKVPELEDGGHIIEVVARGYQAYFDNFATGPDTKQPLQMALLPVLASDTAKAKGQKTELTFAGFNARRTKTPATGKFFTKAQLDAATGRPLANLLKTDAGANIASGPKGESFLALAGQANCSAAIVRDGVRIYPFAAASPLDLDRAFAEQFVGIEVYALPASVPAELKDAGNCGALVLWTRDGAR